MKSCQRHFDISIDIGTAKFLKRLFRFSEAPARQRFKNSSSEKKSVLDFFLLNLLAFLIVLQETNQGSYCLENLQAVVSLKKEIYNRRRLRNSPSLQAYNLLKRTPLQSSSQEFSKIFKTSLRNFEFTFSNVAACK